MGLRIHRTAITIAVSLVAAAGCGGDKSSDVTTATSATEVTNTEAAPTTVSETTPAAATTVPAASQFTLRSDGLGAFDLGTDGAVVLDALITAFGDPVADDKVEYPNPGPPGGYAFTTADGAFGNYFPFGRAVCWSNHLCIDLGGDTAADEIFSGWSLTASSDQQLSTESGVTIGSSGADFPSMQLFAAFPCSARGWARQSDAGNGLQDGLGQLEHIILRLLSSGAPFSGYDDTGAFIESTPTLQEVQVTAMSAGEHPAALTTDC